MIESGKKILLWLLSNIQYQSIPFSDFRYRMKKYGGRDDGNVHNYHSDTLKRMKALLEAGCPVPSRQEVNNAAVSHGAPKKIMIKSSFDALVAMGLPFRQDDFVVVDPARESFLAQHDWGEEEEEEEGEDEEVSDDEGEY